MAAKYPQHESWKDDMRMWPPVTFGHVFYYLIRTKACDGAEMENYKSLESYNYFQSEYVSTIYIKEHMSGSWKLKADVKPSQSVNNKPHAAWVVCESNGHVIEGGCSCMAGRSKTCSHVGAILWKIEYAVKNQMTGKSCTDEIMKWNCSTSKNIAPKAIVDISFQKPKQGATFNTDEELPSIANPKFPKFDSHVEYKSNVDVSPYARLFNVSGTTLNKTVTCSVSKGPSKSLELVHTDHHNMDCNLCMSFYSKYINLCDSKISALNQGTTSQSQSSMWHDSRRIRITASSAKKVPKRQQTCPSKFLQNHIYPVFSGNTNTRHGQESEGKCLKCLREERLVVECHGTVVSRIEPWLSASPDGILTESQQLLEIKCPVPSEKWDTLESLFRQKYDVAYSGDGNLFLSPTGSRGYYTQVQLTLYCTNLQRCLFVVWTQAEMERVIVERDNNTIDELIQRLRHFYFTAMLPRIVDDFNSGRLEFGALYEALCSQ